MLRNFPEVVAPSEALFCRHVYHQYTVRFIGGPRDLAKMRLAEAGVGTIVYYPVPLHQLPVYKGMRYQLPPPRRHRRPF